MCFGVTNIGKTAAMKNVNKEKQKRRRRDYEHEKSEVTRSLLYFVFAFF